MSATIIAFPRAFKPIPEPANDNEIDDLGLANLDANDDCDCDAWCDACSEYQRWLNGHSNPIVD